MSLPISRHSTLSRSLPRIVRPATPAISVQAGTRILSGSTSASSGNATAAPFLQLKAHDAVDAFRHPFDPPGLDDALAGHELDVTAAHIAAVSREFAAFLVAHSGLAVRGEGLVLFRSHQRAIDARRRGL